MKMACENEYAEDIVNLCTLLYAHQITPFEVQLVRCTAGSNSGDNFMSVVKRIELRYHDQQAEENSEGKRSKPFILKRQIASESRRKLYRCDQAFANEIAAYTHLVPLLCHYTRYGDPILPDCLKAGFDKYGEMIVLEDLKAKGYNMPNRKKGLDVDSCVLVMQQLAKLHAASITAKQVNISGFRERCRYIQDIVYCKDAENLYSGMFHTSIEQTLASLRNSNSDGSLTEPIRRIQNLAKSLFWSVQSRVMNPKESLSVVCHGDLYINNIMFKGELNEEGEIENPKAAIFFDLQAMRYSSFIYDILHFIYTSTKRELRDAHTKRLLETYCTALHSHLERQLSNTKAKPLHVLDTLRKTFSLDNVTQEYDAQALYGLAISMWVLPAVTFDPLNLPNLDLLSEKNSDSGNISCTNLLTPEYHSRMKDLVLEFYQKGYLDSYKDA